MGKVVGIDLGTTNSCVAILERGDPAVIANSEGSRTTPSIVAFNENGEKLVGQIAKRQGMTNPGNTVFAVKRLIGRRFEDENVQAFRVSAPFEICEAQNGDAWVKIIEKERSPEEISSLVLERMRDTAQDYLGEEVSDAVITVPAYFNDAQRQATKDAGRIAGLNVLRIVNEPTAAALAYGVGDDTSEVIAVFDLGGGTFDISIMRIGDGVFEVLSTCGDTFLGGEDFDQLLLNHMVAEFQEEHGTDLRGDPMALQRLKEACERAKQELSSCEETDLNLPFITADKSGPKHLKRSLTRDELESLVEPLIERLDEPCRTALSDAGMEPSGVQKVILVGGMTRMPRVQAKVEEIFEQSPDRGVNHDEIVAVGAAIQAGLIKGDTQYFLLLDVTPLSLGVETQGGVATKIIERNTTIPTAQGQVFSTTEDNQTVVSVHVVQGEREMAADTKTLGRFDLVGIPPAPRGVPQIEVNFEIDADGVVNVSAKDLGSGKSQAIRVTASGGLSERDIENLVKEAEENTQADQDRRELVEVRNKADGLVYSTERTLEEFAENVSDEDRKGLEAAIEKTRSVLKGDDLAALRTVVDELSALTYKMTEQLYAELGGDDAE